jgi:hypothetical protein
MQHVYNFYVKSVLFQCITATIIDGYLGDFCRFITLKKRENRSGKKYLFLMGQGQLTKEQYIFP